MSATMTTRDNFPVIDVTHKPKRMQGTNLKTMSEPESRQETFESNVPQSATLERAIQFYESNAQGEYKVLYSQTAKWLREYMTKTMPVVQVPQESPVEAETEDAMRGR